MAANVAYGDREARDLTGLPTFMATSLRLLRLTRDDVVVEGRAFAQAEVQGAMPAVTRCTELNEVRLAFRALIEQLRLVLRDGRRVIRRLIAVCDTSRRSSRVHVTSSPAPLASVPLVVLRSTTEREQIELNDLVERLSAEGHQVARRGTQWVVYTQITDRRKSVDWTIAARQPERRSAALERSGDGTRRRPCVDADAEETTTCGASKDDSYVFS